MNISMYNQTYAADRSALDFIYNIGMLYLVPIVSVFGFLLSTLSLIIFQSPKLNKNKSIYRYFFYKTLAEMFMLSFGCIYPVAVCRTCPIFETFVGVFVRIYFHGFLLIIAYVFLALCEVVIVYDRLVNLNCEEKLNFDTKKVLVLMLALSLAPSIPYLFVNKIELAANTTNKYHTVRTSFSQSRFMLFYNGLFLVMFNCIIFVLVVILNYLLVKKLRTFRAGNKEANRASLVLRVHQNQAAVGQASPRKKLAKKNDSHSSLSIMIFFMSLVFILSRFLHMIYNFLYSYHVLNGLQPSVLVYVLDFNASMSTFCVFIVNFFVYAMFNRAYGECLADLALKCIPSRFFREKRMAI